jgi:hypothetical protein
VPLLIPATPAEPPPGDVLVMVPFTAYVVAAVESLDPATPVPVLE